VAHRRDARAERKKKSDKKSLAFSGGLK